MEGAAMSVVLRPILEGESSFCERVLRSLPDWFGIESALAHYVEQTNVLPTWIAEIDGEPVGFLSIRHHSPHAAEIDCMAVLPAFHRRGVGRAMIEFIERHLREQGIRLLQVKTVSRSRPDPFYEKTRRFYESVGFVPLEEFPNLWPGNPCQQYVKTTDR
jgi:ribosomal protein S18 acetylase RimI-like enzyme